jgi:hypothetical protein
MHAWLSAGAHSRRRAVRMAVVEERFTYGPAAGTLPHGVMVLSAGVLGVLIVQNFARAFAVGVGRAGDSSVVSEASSALRSGVVEAALALRGWLDAGRPWSNGGAT